MLVLPSPVPQKKEEDRIRQFREQYQKAPQPEKRVTPKITFPKKKKPVTKSFNKLFKEKQQTTFVPKPPPYQAPVMIGENCFAAMVVTVYSHFFKVDRITPRVSNIIKEFSGVVTTKTFYQERGKWVRGPDRFFGGKTADQAEYRFHINLLQEFYEFLKFKNVPDSIFHRLTERVYDPDKTPVALRSHLKLYDYQVPAVNYVTDPTREHSSDRSKLLNIQTGKGKGLMAMAAIERLQGRTLVVIKPMYIQKWINELVEKMEISHKDILMIQGSKDFKSLIQMARHGQINHKFIIISSTTYRNFLNAYEDDRYGYDFQDYDIECPEKLCELLEINQLCIDEIHQEFYQIVRILSYTHVPLLIGLSATLESRDAFLNKMYDVVFPLKRRFKGLVYDRYVNVFSVAYNFNDPKRIQTTEFGSSTYSHTAFEKSIMRQHEVQYRYFKLIQDTVEKGFLSNYRRGDRLAIFASSIAMCTALTTYLQRIYPHLIIKRYVEDDPLDNILTADISVTTILSGGTAIDIPNLTCCILTINILSLQSNLQSIGRLRKIEGREVQFYYLFCEQIEKHKEYHTERCKLLKDKALNIKATFYPIRI